ncbi:MAG: dihydroneopterin aldolase [Cyclobacteriaceae bacterium]|jgi:dihydroneopterin aldolase
MKGEVALEGLEFHAYHGVYPHERSSGNKFSVDVRVETLFSDQAFRDDLEGTINYEDLYTLVKVEMERPSKLLESVGHAIAANILARFPMALRAEVKIAKFNPPIGGVCQKAFIVVTESR